LELTVDLIYSQTLHPLSKGRTHRNPRFFTAAESGAATVHVVGDWPNIVGAYEAAGVPVTVVDGLPNPPAPAVADVAIIAGLTAEERAAVDIPADWMDLPWTKGGAAELNLRRLAMNFSDEPVINKPQAFAVIQAELQRRVAAKVPVADVERAVEE
jgi:hypothetical protein